MENAKFIAEFEKAIPGVLLQKQRFGRSSRLCIWVEAKKISLVCRELRAGFGFEKLENFSVMQLEDVLVGTYFLSTISTSENARLVVRCSVPLPLSSPFEEENQKNNYVRLFSVADIWEAASAMEREAAELWGIAFSDDKGQEVVARKQLLPENWRGFPLRKSYRFPEEYSGVRHERARISED